MYNVLSSWWYHAVLNAAQGKLSEGMRMFRRKQLIDALMKGGDARSKVRSSSIRSFGELKGEALIGLLLLPCGPLLHHHITNNTHM